MSKFNPDRLSVEFREGVTATEPLFSRRYTLTHSDTTGELFLTIGQQYAWDKINPKMRDEVIGEWLNINGILHYYIQLYIDQGQFNQQVAERRFDTFRRELPLALTAIRYGDLRLFATYPILNQSPILVNYRSSYPLFSRQENWGSFQTFQWN